MHVIRQQGLLCARGTEVHAWHKAMSLLVVGRSSKGIRMRACWVEKRRNRPMPKTKVM